VTLLAMMKALAKKLSQQVKEENLADGLNFVKKKESAFSKETYALHQTLPSVIADNDCQNGLTCFIFTRGKRCLPDGCDACSDDRRTCYTEENFAEQEEGEEKSCEFVRCQ